jgi:hypothetical protein
MHRKCQACERVHSLHIEHELIDLSKLMLSLKIDGLDVIASHAVGQLTGLAKMGNHCEQHVENDGAVFSAVEGQADSARSAKRKRM